MPLPKSSAVIFLGTLIVVASAGLSFVAVTGLGEPPASVASSSVMLAAAAPKAESTPAPLPVRDRSEPKEVAPPPARDSREPKPQVAPPAAPEAAAPPSSDRERNLRITSPYGDVAVERERGKLRVRAPYAAVDVDENGGRVRVRAPYVDLDIRW